MSKNVKLGSTDLSLVSF